ncbi:hypothetical protein Ancab_035323 [Ancistrocladus abbreviatus]
MNIEADSGHVVSESHYTEQPPANTSSIKGRSKVRVGKRKPAKVKPTTEIGEDDRLTGITIGDSGIENMNRLIINGLEDLSAANIWVVSKTLGVEASGDESEVIKHLKAMEDRDQLQWRLSGGKVFEYAQLHSYEWLLAKSQIPGLSLLEWCENPQSLRAEHSGLRR